MQATDLNLASYIDHTLLKPEATRTQIEKICNESLEFSFAGVCVNSYYISLVSTLLKDSPVIPVCVVGFPLGAMSSLAKAYETEYAIKMGAHEIDMVLNIGAMKEKNHVDVLSDIADVVNAASGFTVKVIIETALLSDDEKRKACLLAVDGGARFVKTSSGFNGGGATIEDIKLMREAVGSEIGVKASGGIKTTQQALALISAGANRLGTSSGVALLQNKLASGY